MKNEDFVEASAYIRVLEKRMLTNDAVNRMLDSSGAQEALRQISQNSEYDFSAKKPEHYEEAVKSEIKRVYELMYKFAGKNRAVIDVLACKYDFHNIKVALKSKYTKKSERRLYSNISGTDPLLTEEFVFNGVNNLPQHIALACEEAEKNFNETKNPEDIDLCLDKLMFAHMLSLCGEIKNNFITEYVRISIDYQNIKTLLRVKNMQKSTRFLRDALIPGGLTDADFFLKNYDKPVETLPAVFFYKYFSNEVKRGLDGYGRIQNFSVIEKLFDDRLVEHTKQAKYIAFGPEVLFAYVLSKENEARQIRIIAACKLNGVRAEALRERLRDNYA